MSEQLVYEIDLEKKYILRLPDNLSTEEYIRIGDKIRQWLHDDNPILVITGYAELIKVSELE